MSVSFSLSDDIAQIQFNNLTIVNSCVWVMGIPQTTRWCVIKVSLDDGGMGGQQGTYTTSFIKLSSKLPILRFVVAKSVKPRRVWRGSYSHIWCKCSALMMLYIGSGQTPPFSHLFDSSLICIIRTAKHQKFMYCYQVAISTCICKYQINRYRYMVLVFSRWWIFYVQGYSM